ncbi:MAG: chemotaxis protein CheR [Proteobacteria bacterium]|nr:MAG: chemotaxis protein CheR [Pseudomonadota bacterium]
MQRRPPRASGASQAIARALRGGATDEVLSDHSFDVIRSRVYALTGIVIAERKRYLLMSRLAGRLRALGLEDYNAYARRLADDAHATSEAGYLVNALTTNETYFFREPRQFEVLEQQLPKLHARVVAAGRRTLRIWSAACSTGEEPYTIAMVLHRFIASKPGAKAMVLATDVDTNVLAQAQRGRYSTERLSLVPERYRRYLQPDGDGVVVHPLVRGLVGFHQVNLMNDAFRFQEPVDVIFLRNVLIYFDAKGKSRVVRKLHEVARPGGLVFVGSSESLLREAERFKLRHDAIYEVIK